MVLSYHFDIIKHYFLIEEMNCHRHQDKVHIVSALMDIYNYTLDKSYSELWHWLSNNYDFVKLLYCITFNIERILS